MKPIIQLSVGIFLVLLVATGAAYLCNPKIDIAMVFLIPFSVSVVFFLLVGGLWAIDNPHDKP